jgi:hypothetical protein
MKASRIATVLVATVLTALFGGGAAFATAHGAGANHRIYLPGGGPFTGVGYCAFPVDLTTVSNEYIVKSSTAPDGTYTQRVTGRFVGTLKNDVSGKTVTLNISGPGTFTLYPDGSATNDSQGRTLLTLDPVGQADTGLPGIFLTTGKNVTTFDSNGEVTSFSSKGPIIDECAALSS